MKDSHITDDHSSKPTGDGGASVRDGEPGRKGCIGEGSIVGGEETGGNGTGTRGGATTVAGVGRERRGDDNASSTWRGGSRACWCCSARGHASLGSAQGGERAKALEERERGAATAGAGEMSPAAGVKARGIAGDVAKDSSVATWAWLGRTGLGRDISAGDRRGAGYKRLARCPRGGRSRAGCPAVAVSSLGRGRAPRCRRAGGHVDVGILAVGKEWRRSSHISCELGSGDRVRKAGKRRGVCRWPGRKADDFRRGGGGWEREERGGRKET